MSIVREIGPVEEIGRAAAVLEAIGPVAMTKSQPYVPVLRHLRASSGFSAMTTAGLFQMTLIAVAFVLAIAPRTAHSARICKGGHLYYSGSEFQAQRSEAEASAIQAWRRVKARTQGADQAAQMFPAKAQLHCESAVTKTGWRCFVRGGRCHHT